MPARSTGRDSRKATIRVGMSEATQFQVDYDEARELAVEKEQVDTIPLVANSQPALTSNEGEVPAQL